MEIKKITLKNFRSYEKLEMYPHPGVNLLFGQNGVGKTNLLEAIHYCALGRSHRIAQDREVVRRGQTSGQCDVIIEKQSSKNEILMVLTPEEAKKKNVYIDKKKTGRLSELMGQIKCVIFSPEDLMLIKEGPAIRRKFTDMMLSQISPAYFMALQQYQRALEQRNALLREDKKNGTKSDEMLDVFEEQLAENMSVIIPQRKKMIGELAEIAEAKYKGISGSNKEQFRMKYHCCMNETEAIKKTAIDRLKKGRNEDTIRMTTGFGIHREDIDLTLNQKEMKLFASQGQIRTAALSMKLAQIALFEKETGEKPILLLDDVMSELDMTRRKRLLEEIVGIQTFVTCTDESDLAGCENLRTYRVEMNEDGIASIREMTSGEEIHSVEENEEPDFT